MVFTVENTLTILGYISTIVGLISTGFSIAIWFKLKSQRKFDEQRIVISLVVPNTDKKITLPCRIERKHLTRAEVQGVLGTIPFVGGKTRYDIQFFNSAEFYSRLEDVQDLPDQTELLIDCTLEEIPQFNLDKMRKSCTVIGFPVPQAETPPPVS
jgi:hypothetical protein